MQVDLFKDNVIVSNLCRDLGKLRTNSCKSKSLPEEVLVKALQLGGFTEEEYLKCLKTSQRSYLTVLGLQKDSHYPLEFLGLSKTARPYVYVVNLEDSLDLILGFSAQCPLDTFNYVSGFDIFSKAVLNLNFDTLADYRLSYLINLSSELNLYLYNILKHSDKEQECLGTLVTNINQTVTNILAYTGFFLQRMFEGLVVKSICGSKLILASYTKYPELDELIITYLNEKKSVSIECYDRGEWLNEILK